jgi:hypothetical protein
MPRVRAVKGNAAAARSQVSLETSMFPVPVECTNWVEKKFFLGYELGIISSYVERIAGVSYLNYCSREVDETDNCQDLNRSCVLRTPFLR